MPIKQIFQRRVDPKTRELRKELAREWRHPHKTGQPVIVQEYKGSSRPTHLFVVWDKWDSLTKTQRSEIIMDAYEDTHKSKEVLNVIVAMGLTTQEADRMFIIYR